MRTPTPEREPPTRRARGAAPAGLALLFASLALGLPVRAQEDDACLGCHTDTGIEIERDGRTISLDVDLERYQASSHAEAGCVACHADLAGVEDFPHARGLEKVSCTDCHDDDDGPVAAYRSSVHATAGVGCAQCHLPHEIGLPPRSSSAPSPAPTPECASCHAGELALWGAGVHALDPGNGHAAASCVDCHGAHDVHARSDPRSRVYPLRLPDTCESCHHPDPSPEHPAPGGEKVAQYERSVHGRALREQGLVVTATCASCHGAHDVRPPASEGAPTSRAELPFTCGACHAGILNRYLEGVHGAAFEAGSRDVPVCNDCHTEHAVSDPALEGSSVSKALVAETCARCHADDELAKRHGLRSSVRRSFGSSYHGIAGAFGESSAANCASCHGFHDVLPSSDARSPVHPANLQATCGNCHAGAGAAFARVPVHSLIDREETPIAWTVQRVYAVLVAVLVGAFALFVLVDLFGRLRLRLRIGPAEQEPVDPRDWPDEDALVAPQETFRRMGRAARLQHVVLILSFSLLVLTGLPVFLHDTPWMGRLIDLEGGFALRSRLHRAAALGLIGLSLWHLVALALVPGARRWFRTMMFRPRDLGDFVQDLAFSLGAFAWVARSPRLARLVRRFPWLRFDRRPALGRYGLVEKLEYGAVLWGNLVMIVTGTILWRPDWFLGWMPSWTFEVCRIVHGFEATLAFLAIVIWHMYHVHLRPGVFPMSRVWLDGRVSREELRRHHPEEYLAILERRRAEGGGSPADGGERPGR